MKKLWIALTLVLSIAAFSNCDAREIIGRIQSRGGRVTLEPEPIRDRIHTARRHSFQCRINTSEEGRVRVDVGLIFDVAERAQHVSNQWSPGQTIEVRESKDATYPLQLRNMNTHQTVLARRPVMN